MMPPGGADQLRKFDAILFGAVGAPGIPDHITLWGLRLSLYVGWRNHGKPEDPRYADMLEKNEILLARLRGVCTLDADTLRLTD